MRPSIRRIVSTAASIAAVSFMASGSLAGTLRIVASDARGVTLQMSVGEWSVSAPNTDGRVQLLAAGSHLTGEPGRAQLPVWNALLAVPEDAHPIARVVSGSGTTGRDGIHVVVTAKPDFERDDAGHWEPTRVPVPPIADGPWPAASVQLGTPSHFRGRTLVGIEVRPFRYDEAAAHVEVTPTLTVRVDFVRPQGAAALPALASAPDAHFDDVLRGTVLNWDQAAPWRRSPAAPARHERLVGPSAALGYDESQPEVRVQIDSTGIWQLPFDQLAQHHYPAGVPIAQVSVHRHEFLENSNPPFATIELPIEVDDANHNGVFDSGDRIWVYVRTWAERSGASRMQRLWGDAEVIYATVRQAGGLRVGTRAGWRGTSGLTPLASYPLFTHWEADFAEMIPYVTLPMDTTIDLYNWTSSVLYYDRPDTIQFTVNDIDTSRAVTAAAGFVGRAAGEPHFAWAALENPAGRLSSVADSVEWYGIYPSPPMGTTLHGSALGNGINHFVDWAKTFDAPPSRTSNLVAHIGLDWFETTYWRRYNAVHDQLACNSADTSGEFQLHLGGFLADSIRVWDVTNPDAPVRLLIDAAHAGGGAVEVQDSVAAGHRRSYVAAAIQDPPADGYGPRVPPDANFHDVNRQFVFANGACDYLMIVPEGWQANVQPLVQQRLQQGLRVLVATAEDVYDEFNGGRHSATAIRRLAKYAYQQWSTRFLMLVGDGTLDPRNINGHAGTDFIPCNPVPGPVSVPQGWEITVSDNLYGCLSGNCDPIFGGGDVVPELMIGRLPVNSSTDVDNVVRKIVGYEDLTGDNTWRQHVLLVSDDDFSAATTFGGGGTGNSYCEKPQELYFLGINNTCEKLIEQQAGLSQMNVEQFSEKAYLGTTQKTYIDPLYGTCRVDLRTTQDYTQAYITPQLFSHIGGTSAAGSGSMWVNFQGHANENVLTHESLYQNIGDEVVGDDKWKFFNTAKPIVWTAFSCHSNMFARGNMGPGSGTGGCLGEDMVTLPTGGAVATWASDCYEVVPRDTTDHLNVEFADAMFLHPAHDSQLSDHGARVVLGEVIEQALQTFVHSAVSYSLERGVGVTYTLLGDPATRISSGRPSSNVTANGVAAVDGQPVRLHTPGDTLLVNADLVSTARIDSLQIFVNTGGADVRIPVANAHGSASPDTAFLIPAFPDTVGGGVSGGNRYQMLLHGTLLPQTYHYRFHTQDRDGLTSDFTLLFELDATVRVDGNAIHEGDDVSPTANLSVLVQSPTPIDPATDLVMTLNGTRLATSAVPAPGDPSGREWVVTWTHDVLSKDDYQLSVSVRSGTPLLRHFRVTTAVGELKLAELFAFPNPFDNDGTNFSFELRGSDPADVRISVYTITGRRLWSYDWNGLVPGYHQQHWDGRDAEGDELANGVYLYRLSATTAAGRRVNQLGRLIKLRKPRHIDYNTTATP